MITAAQRIWETALGQLQLQVSRPSYDTWLKETRGLSIGQDLLTVGVPTSFAAAWLERRMCGLIQRTLEDIAKQPLRVQFRVVAPQQGSRPERNDQPSAPCDDTEHSCNGLSHDSFIGNGNGATNGLSSRYTFENFIVGASNQLAYAAARAVAERPGEAYNPLFIYADVGLGKTHLLHAISHAAAQRELITLYVTTEHFTNDFILAIRNRKTEEFRNKYRSVDILLLDDIQFIAGKEQTQEAIFHTFNELHNTNRQIVVACDRSPKELPFLEERLRSRFEWGLAADIQRPNLETRLAILKTKMAHQAIQASEEVITFIAQRVQHNIRELEGSLNRIVAWGQFRNKPITLDLAPLALPYLLQSPPTPQPSPQAVIGLVTKYFGATADDILSRKRDRRVTLARHVAVTLLVVDQHLTSRDIGTLFGLHDASITKYARKRVKALEENDPSFNRELHALRNELRSYS